MMYSRRICHFLTNISAVALGWGLTAAFYERDVVEGFYALLFSTLASNLAYILDAVRSPGEPRY